MTRTKWTIASTIPVARVCARRLVEMIAARPDDARKERLPAVGMA